MFQEGLGRAIDWNPQWVVLMALIKPAPVLKTRKMLLGIKSGSHGSMTRRARLDGAVIPLYLTTQWTVQ